MKSPLNAYRWVGRFEGVSLLTLFLIAMPMKYVFHEPQMVRVVGSIHGFLFILYGAFSVYLTSEFAWPGKKLMTALFMSCLPFGTFFFEKKYLPEQA